MADTMYDHLMVIFNDPNFMLLSVKARDALYAAQRLNDELEATTERAMRAEDELSRIRYPDTTGQ